MIGEKAKTPGAGPGRYHPLKLGLAPSGDKEHDTVQQRSPSLARPSYCLAAGRRWPSRQS